jgi:hypothetical protein
MARLYAHGSRNNETVGLLPVRRWTKMKPAASRSFNACAFIALVMPRGVNS